MKSDFNPEKITLPPELEIKTYLTTREFADMAGVTVECVYLWGKKDYLRIKKFGGRCHIPKNEVLRYLRGELRMPRAEGAEPKPK
jgi:hypothetical protein